MAIAIVQSVQALDIGDVTVTANLSGVTAGNSVILLADWYHATSTISSITCTSESNLTLLGTPIRAPSLSNRSFQFAVLNNITASGAKTFVATFSAGGDMRIIPFEVSGGNTSGISDGTPQGATGTGSTASVSLTTNQAGCAVFALCSAMSAEPTVDTGWTLIDQANQQWFEAGQYNLNVGAAGAKTVQMSVSGAWVIAAAAFRAAGGSSGIAAIAQAHYRRRRNG